MMATSDSVFQEVGTVMYEVSEDEHMRQILEAREDARRNENDMKKYYQKRIDEANAKADAAVKERDDAARERDAALARVAELEKQLAAKS